MNGGTATREGFALAAARRRDSEEFIRGQPVREDIQDRTGLRVACAEGVAYRRGYLDRAAFKRLAELARHESAPAGAARRVPSRPSSSTGVSQALFARYQSTVAARPLCNATVLRHPSVRSQSDGSSA
jgi:hypothetical protein